jgi:MFS family permease
MLRLLRDREFCTLIVTQFFSVAGDQLARVALTVLVFNRTDSALQAAVAYALTFVPAAIGGPLLSGLADRIARRDVLICADLLRVPLIALIALPNIPLPLAMVLVALAGLLEAPFAAARGALLPDVLPGEQYPVGYAFSQIVAQAAQVAGFGVAGILLIALSPSTLLLLDAATFVLSAALIAKFVRWRPAAASGAATKGSARAWWTHAVRDLKTSVRVVMRDGGLRPLAGLAWAASSFAISYEALGAPLARVSDSPTWTVGLLLAMQPLGTVIGALYVGRVGGPRREPAMRLLALVSLLPLLVGFLRPGLGVLVVIGLVSGFGWSFNILASTTFVGRVAPEVRGRALGFVGTGLLVGQGLGVVAAGALANVVDARVALGILGLLGTAAALVAIWDGIRGASAVGRTDVHPAE